MKVLIYTYQAILLIATLTGIVRFSRLTTPARVLVLLLVSTCICEGISTTLAYRKCNNIFIYHFLVIISFWFYSYMYYLLIPASRLRLRILVIPLLYTPLALINSLYFEKLNEFPSINLILYGVSLSVYAILYFKQLIDLDLFDPSVSNPLFLFNTAVLIYFTMETFNWGILRYLISKRYMTLDPLIYFGYIASILYYFTLGISILLSNKAPSPPKK
jgi:hypothetical protein